MAQLKSTNITGNLAVTGNILASKIIKLGGTADQILLANGDVATLGNLNYSLPLAADGTRGGIQIGYTSTENNRAVELSSEKAYISLPTRLSGYKSGVENAPSTNGFYFFNDTTNESAKTAFDSSAQAATWVSAYDNTWGGQLGISYYSDNIAFRRKQGSTTWGNWIGIATKTWVENKGYLTSHQSLDGYVKGPTSSTDNAIVRFDGAGGRAVQNSGVIIDDGNNLTVPGKVVQGTKNTDETITNMNQFTSDLYVKGDGSAPNSPKVAGFYLGKSTSDENRHMDIVTGSTVSYIDFNRSGTVRDYDFRFRVNNDSGSVLMQWDPNYSADAKLFKIENGILEATTIRKTGGADTHVLLAGGGTKSLDDLKGNVDFSLKTSNAVTHSGWTDFTTDSKIVPTMSFIAYWNGAYSSSNASNLSYCAHGTIVGTNNVSSSGNRGSGKVVSAAAAGRIDSEKFSITSGSTVKATYQYNSTDDCVELVWA